MKINRILLIIFLQLAFLFFSNTTLFCQYRGIHVDQAIVQTTTITNKKLIKFLTEDFMIPEKKINKMVIYDLSGDGFGELDIAKTYPGGKSYLLTPSKKAQNIMNKWSFGGNVKFIANSNDSPEYYESAPDTVRPMGGVFAALLRGLRRNYKGAPIKLHLEQDKDVTSIEMWGYNPNLMKYLAPPVSKVPEKIPVMKLVYLEKTVVDSIFIEK